MANHSDIASAEDCTALCTAETAFDCVGFLWKTGEDHVDTNYLECFAQVCSTLDTVLTTPTIVEDFESWRRD